MKNKLRQEYILKRTLLDEVYRTDASEKIFMHVENLPQFKNAKSMFVYLSFGEEVATLDFINKHVSSKQIYVPKIVGADMQLVAVTNDTMYEQNKFGILEPVCKKYYEGMVDLVITPAIVFDKFGYRLGYGKGYYDKYFAKKNYSYAVGVCYEKMLVEKLTIQDFDKKVNLVITERGIVNEYNSYN